MISSLVAMCSIALGSAEGSIPILLTDVVIVDGTGKAGFRGEILLQGETIVAVGAQVRRPRFVQTFSLNGQHIAPGFIDSHSHAGDLEDDLSAKTQLFQGITTAVVGQDGSLFGGFQQSMSDLARLFPPINYAAFSGHNTARTKVMGKDFERAATLAEVKQMTELVKQDMEAGALGLSTGLEYNPGFFSTTEEVVALAKVASRFGGTYITHMRSEDKKIIEAIQETIFIGQEARIPVQISHLKLGLPMVWGRGKEVIEIMDQARKDGVKISADVYPYRYWHSSVTVLTSSRDWDKLEVWQKAIDDTGGADKILLARYTPDAEWEGKTIDEIATLTKKSAAEVLLEIVKATNGPDSKDRANVIVTAMDEADIETFLQWPHTAICSDGGNVGRHPRCAGSFPRVLAYYVREKNVLSLEDAVRKMTQLPAKQFGFKTRGQIRPGFMADFTIFNPATIQDNSTPKDPLALATGVSDVMIAGKWVIREGKQTGVRTGRIITRTGKPFRL